MFEFYISNVPGISSITEKDCSPLLPDGFYRLITVNDSITVNAGNELTSGSLDAVNYLALNQSSSDLLAYNLYFHFSIALRTTAII